MQAIIVDDEPLARERIREFLSAQPDINVRAECRTGHEAVKAIENHDPDLVFLDIQMPDLDGFGVIHEVGPERMPQVIFVTAYNEYAVRAFEANAVDYLLKPFDRVRFDQAVGRAREIFERRRLGELDQRMSQLLEMTRKKDGYLDRLVVRSGSSVFFIKAEDIDWLEASRNYVKIHCGAEVKTMRETISALEERLDPEKFVRIHRSTIVNLDRIRKIEPGFGSESVAELEDGTRLMISRAYRRGKLRQIIA